MSGAQDTVSVIINCYNGANYISQAIESVLNQRFPHWNLLIWDNRSTDHTRDVVNPYLNDPRIRYHLAEHHTSLGEARNLASKMVQGTWIGFLDVDDVWLPRKLEEQMKIAESEPDVGLVYCRTKLMYGTYKSQDDYCRFYATMPLPEGNVLTQLLLVENFIPLVSAIVRRQYFLASGGIPAHYKQAEDFYLFCLIAQSWKVRAWQDIGCYYRLHAHNLSKTQKIEEFAEVIDILNHFKDSVPPHREHVFRTILEANKQRLELTKLRTWREVHTIKLVPLFKEIIRIFIRKSLGSRYVADYRARLETMQS